MLDGCYEGDQYEPLGFKIEESALLIFIPMEDVIIELSLHDAVFKGHTMDEFSFILEIPNEKIYFKVNIKKFNKVIFVSHVYKINLL